MFFVLINVYFFILNIHTSILSVDEEFFIRNNVSSKYVASKIQESDINFILRDPENIISKEFNIQAGLKNRVLFWAKVYAIYPSTTTIIHDREDLSTIYKVMDFTKLWADTKINKYKKISVMANDIKKEINYLENIFKNLIIKTKYSKEEKLLFNKFKKKFLASGKNKKTFFEELIKNIRTQSGQSNFFQNGIRMSGVYMDKIEKIFIENNLPVELSRLPFVESSFDFKAISKVGATGLWQIMDETGEYYFELSKHIDERSSPIKASEVAAKILKENYKILKTWPLAITAYNFGSTRLFKAVKKFKNNDFVYLLDNYKHPYFKFAAMNFYAEFLAALYVYSYYEKIFGNISKSKSINVEGIVLEFDLSINEIASITGLDAETIAKLNPDLKKEIRLASVKISKGYEIKLPSDVSIKLISYFVKYIDSISSGVN